VTARWVEAPGPERAVAVDLERARQVMAAAQQLKKKLKLKGTVDLAFVARQPDVITATNGGSGAGGGEQLVQWSDIQAIVERGARAVEAQAPARLKAEHARLKQAVAELTAQATVDEQRLALEIALLADKL